MPGMDGWELLKTLRGMGISQAMIMISADAIDGPEYATGANANFRSNDDFIAKPIRDNQLLDKVAAVLGLDWIYGDADPEHSRMLDYLVTTLDINNPAAVKDCHELLSMAELGFADGVEKAVQRIEARNDAPEFVASVRACLGEFRFAEITDLCRHILGRIL